MFTINIYLRFALIAAGFFLGIGLWIAFGFWYGFFFLLAAIILLAGYFLLGTVQSAAVLLQSGDIAGAEKQMSLTIKPQWLYVANRSVFFMMQGMIAIQKGDFERGEKILLKTLESPLSDNEKGMIIVQLASAHANKQRWTQAQNYYRQAQKLKITEPLLKEQMGQLDLAFAQKGQTRHAIGMKNGMNMQQFSGKRRRPKPR